MDVDLDKNILEVIVRPIGIKTKGIINFNQVYIKGPYFNGLFGIKRYKKAHQNQIV